VEIDEKGGMMPKRPFKKPTVDHRENEAIKRLMREVGFQVYKVNRDGDNEGIELEVGDYSQRIRGDREVVVERKSDDFLPSLFSGRLNEQLASIVNDNNIITGFLIIDKSYDDLLAIAMENGVHENVIHGAIASCCLKGFVPLFAGDVYNFRKVVDRIFAKARDGKDRIYRPKVRVGKGETIITFPGVGEEIGVRLFAHFGSIKAIINATKEQLMEVHGVGAKVADKIIKLVN
jgi:Fanconi anemia group M protein